MKPAVSRTAFFRSARRTAAARSVFWAALISFALLVPPLAAAAQTPPAKSPETAEPLVVYSALTATTAQLPLMGALRAGWPPDRAVRLEWWKNLDDLRSVMLAGRGDVWIGHLESFARAAARGAPVTLTAVTVWRKFHFVSAPLPLGPDGDLAYPANVRELLAFATASGEAVTLTPQNAPSAGLLARLTAPAGPVVESLPPQQLSLELLQGRRRMALMPEPLVSSVTAKNPQLKIIGSLEEAYAEKFGGPGLTPQAGTAVNRALLEREPALVEELLTLMERTAAELAGRPAEAAALLPPETAEALGVDVLTASLVREPLIVRRAAEVRPEIDAFLRLAAPELFEPGAPAIPESFWGGAAAGQTTGPPAAQAGRPAD
ncbi:MAG: hypothetical protein LBU12_09680 [Deltaproteobacteria bacterium]|jgi:NitT/TauT family transport system substrate-binding protein|nr:hypothetical protein [Deltaproteobacteria bacterium]